jgi:hypothetical protein
MAMAATAEPTMPPAPPQQSVPSAPSALVSPRLERSRFLVIWRAVRLGSGILLGTLVILLGGLVWAGHKRRI